MGLPVEETAGGYDVPAAGGVRQVRIKRFVAQVEVRAVRHQDIVLKAGVSANGESRRFVERAVTGAAFQ